MRRLRRVACMLFYRSETEAFSVFAFVCRSQERTTTDVVVLAIRRPGDIARFPLTVSPTILGGMLHRALSAAKWDDAAAVELLPALSPIRVEQRQRTTDVLLDDDDDEPPPPVNVTPVCYDVDDDDADDADDAATTASQRKGKRRRTTSEAQRLQEQMAFHAQDRKHYTLKTRIENWRMKHYARHLQQTDHNQGSYAVLMMEYYSQRNSLPHEKQLRQFYAASSGIQVVYVAMLLDIKVDFHWILVVLFPRKGRVAATVGEKPNYDGLSTFLTHLDSILPAEREDWNKYEIPYRSDNLFTTMTCYHPFSHAHMREAMPRAFRFCTCSGHSHRIASRKHGT